MRVPCQSASGREAFLHGARLAWRGITCPPDASTEVSRGYFAATLAIGRRIRRRGYFGLDAGR